MTYWGITGVTLVAAALAVTLARAQPPPITIECTFNHVDPNFGNYSKTKVAPNNIAWLKPGADPYIRPGHVDRTTGFVVLGRGVGHLTASTDLPKLCIKLANVASDHGANAINFQILDHGTQLRVQFLRVEDAFLQSAGRRHNPPPQ
jgi:hypothetical protein